MNKKLDEALNNVDATYGDIVEIANDITRDYFTSIDSIVNTLNVTTNLPIDTLRDMILKLQLKAYELSEVKEKSAMKAEIAEALLKEKFAVSFNGADGSAAVKDKLALIAVSEETVAEVLYNLVANLFKTKLDQVHRLVDALKSILMSRMQETKFMNIGIDNSIPATTNGRTNL